MRALASISLFSLFCVLAASLARLQLQLTAPAAPFVCSNLQPEKKSYSEDAPSKYPQGTPMPDEGKHKKVDYQGPEYKSPPDYTAPDYKTPAHPVPEYKAPEYKAPGYKAPEYKVDWLIWVRCFCAPAAPARARTFGGKPDIASKLARRPSQEAEIANLFLCPLFLHRRARATTDTLTT
jgi:hypothetical protein